MSARPGRPRGLYQRTNYPAILFNSPDQIEEKTTLDGWIAGVMERLGVARTPAFSLVLLDLIRFRTGKKAPPEDAGTIEGVLTEKDLPALYDEIRAAIMADVKQMIAGLIQDGGKFQVISDAREKHIAGGDLEPITEDVLANILEDFED